MKKDTIPVVMLLAATLLASSCSKSSDDPSPQPAPIQSSEIYFMTSVLASQIEQISQTYTFDVGGVKKTFELSDMTEIKDLKDYKSYKEQLDNAIILNGLKGLNIKTFKYDLGSLEKGKVAKVESVVYKAKEDAPKVDMFDLLIVDKIDGYKITSVLYTPCYNSECHFGILTEPVTVRDNHLSKISSLVMKLSFIYK